jgi:hypothetical protein
MFFNIVFALPGNTLLLSSSVFIDTCARSMSFLHYFSHFVHTASCQSNY